VTDGTRIGDLALYRRIAAELRPYWPQIAGILALNLASAPPSLLAPLPLKIVVDTVIGTMPLPNIIAALVPAWVSASQSARLGFAGLLLVVISLLTYVLILAVWVLKNYTGEKLTVWFRARLFHRRAAFVGISRSEDDDRRRLPDTERCAGPAVSGAQWVGPDGEQRRRHCSYDLCNGADRYFVRRRRAIHRSSALRFNDGAIAESW
jgi:hypothetical protein